MSTHTPGPWEIGRTNGGKVKIYAAGRGDDWSKWWIAQPLSARPKERDANARLIAAAPDLLKALKDVLEYMPSITAFQRERIRRAEAAIAKAEGK